MTTNKFDKYTQLARELGAIGISLLDDDDDDFIEPNHEYVGMFRTIDNLHILVSKTMIDSDNDFIMVFDDCEPFEFFYSINFGTLDNTGNFESDYLIPNHFTQTEQLKAFLDKVVKW